MIRRRRERVPGVYGINVGGRWYVGAALDVDGRLAMHRRELCRGVHRRKRLQCAFDAVSHMASYYVLERVSDATSLQQRETCWIHDLNAIAKGYNTYVSLGHRKWGQPYRRQRADSAA